MQQVSSDSTKHSSQRIVWRKPQLRLAAALVLVTALSAFGSSKAEYETGKLLDLKRDETGAGALRAQGTFCLAIQIGDLDYLVNEEATWRWNYQPTDLIVGDPVSVRVKGKNLYIKRDNGADLKTQIVRRERAISESRPATCAVPVQQK